MAIDWKATVQSSVKGLDVDYVMLATQDTMVPIRDARPTLGPGSGRHGRRSVRLIDNVTIDWSMAAPSPTAVCILELPSRLGTLR